jgi:sporulation protein YlmC with PRC-barrel domain
MQEINVELLLGRQVSDAEGRKVGRIQELRCDRQDRDCLVESYLVGFSGLMHRLNAWPAWSFSRLFPRISRYAVYEIPWDQMDLSNPEKPRTTLAKQDLSLARR